MTVPAKRWWQFWKQQPTTVPDGKQWIRCPKCGELAQAGGAYAGFWCSSCEKVIPAPGAGTRSAQVELKREVRKPSSVAPADKEVKVWYRNKADAEQVVAQDPAGLRPHLRVLLAHMERVEKQISEADHSAIMDAVQHGRYKIVPSTNKGDKGFDLIFLISKKPQTWSEGQPNPTSKSVTRVRVGTSSGLRFLCPTCSTPNTVLDADINDLAGALVICDDGCQNVSHVPAAYKTRPDASDLVVHGGVRVPIAEFNDWMLAHPSFRTPDGKLRSDVQFHGNYGLWGFCAGCQHKYASTVIAASPSWGGELYAESMVIFNANSEESRQDFEALSKKQCPRCGSPDLIAIMVDVPKDVRDAITAEKKKRGL